MVDRKGRTEKVGKIKGGRGKGLERERVMGEERVGEVKAGRDCAVLKNPLKSPGAAGPSLNLRQIDFHII